MAPDYDPKVPPHWSAAGGDPDLRRFWCAVLRVRGPVGAGSARSDRAGVATHRDVLEACQRGGTSEMVA